jgi:arginyl-tRNA synthetase
MEQLRVSYDVWFSERSLYQGGQYEKAMKLLRDAGYLIDREGATWFTSTAFGDEEDKVVVRRTGVPTYFAADVAYHFNKFFERHFDRVIDVLGADHQGHVPFMKAVAAALGVAPERLDLMIYQLVTLKRGGETVRLSKRTGDLITVREVVEEVGPDACRFFFLSRAPESQMEFDLELAKQESSENPVYYIQYAHARIASILRLAHERGIEFDNGDLSLLTHDAELALIRKMLVLPEMVETMAHSLEPHHLPHYAVELATAFHWFYQQCRVVSSAPGDAQLTKARLKLVDAAKIVLARCLELMIMEAPEQM